LKDRPAVLIVEDDLSWQMIYQEILKEEGYLVDVATNRAEAAAKLARNSFDVAILDLRLIDWDPKNQEGIQVVELFLGLETPPQVIVKSGYLTQAVRTQLEELGVLAVLDKAGSIQELTDLVAQALTVPQK
jgi:CheY-like chemotaxis protein